MSDKSRFGITGSGAVLAAGILALGAVVYAVVFTGGDDPVETPEVAVLEPPTKPEPVTEVSPAPAAPEPVPTAESGVKEPVTVPEQTAEVEEPIVEPEATPEPTPEAEETAEVQPEPEPAEEAPAPEVEEVTPIEGPAFDVVRIDPFGAAVIAGRAAPGATVILLADEAEVAETVADRNGKFVALFDLPPSAEPRSLSADMRTADGMSVPSSGTILIAPTKPVEVAELEVEAEPEAQVETQAEPDELVEPETDVTNAEITSEEVSVEETPVENVPAEDASIGEVASETKPEIELEIAAEAATETEAAPAVEETVATAESEPEPEPEPETQPTSPAIVLADESGVTVLQPAPQPAVPTKNVVSDIAPEVVANLVIDTITYDTQGDVALSGRGEGASFARVYLDDKPVQTVKIDPDGTWRTPLPDIDAGVYRLRIDEVSSEGTVTSRVETPFQREEPEIVADAAQRPNAVTVQEGFTLWAIAKDRFGDGTEYVRVYEANRELIRDPDLIYPGQIFELPEG